MTTKNDTTGWGEGAWSGQPGKEGVTAAVDADRIGSAAGDSRGALTPRRAARG